MEAAAASRPAADGVRPGRHGRGAADDRPGQRHRDPGRAHLGGDRGRRPRHPRPVQPEHRGRAAGRAARDPGHLADRPRGLADPVRLRLGRRAGVLRAAADRDRGRAQARPGRPRRAQPGRTAPRDRHGEPGAAVQGARASAARAPSGSSSSSRTRSTPSAVPDEPVRIARRRAAWRDQVTQGLQGLGWSARDAEAACARGRAPGWPRTRTSVSPS